jgi:hypothetical protein
MKNKHKLFLSLAVLIIVAGGYFFRAEITSFATTDNDLDKIPETDNRILTASVEAQQIPGTQEYGLFQKYQVDQDEYCIRDCAISCKADNLEMYRAYVQSYGNCMCKCLPAD